MAAFDFPSSPTDGQTYSLNGMTFKYSSARTAWEPYAAPLFIGAPVIYEYVCVGGETSVTIPVPQNFRDMDLLVVGRNTAAGTGGVDLRLQFNGDTGNNYGRQRSFSTSTTPSSEQATAQAFIRVGELPTAGNVANYPGVSRVRIPNYADATYNQAVLFDYSFWNNSSVTNWYESHGAGSWNNTAAVTSMTVSVPSGAFAAGTIISVQGVGGGGAALIPGPPTYYSRVTSGSYTFANSPSPASGNTMAQVTIPASNVARVFAVEGFYETNSSGGSSSGINVSLDKTTNYGSARMLPLIDGTYTFGILGTIAASIVPVPGDNAAHTIETYGGQFGGGGGFTVTTDKANIVARQIA